MQEGDRVRILVKYPPGRKDIIIGPGTVGIVTQLSTWYRVAYQSGTGNLEEFWFPGRDLTLHVDMAELLDFTMDEIQEAEEVIDEVFHRGSS